MRERWVPPWLSTGNAEKFLYAIGVHADMFADALIAGVASRFPNVYSDESLPIIGRERRIARGPNEASATYAARLRRWLDDHRRRGGPYALLAQLAAYYAPNGFRIDLFYKSGRHFTMQPDGTITRGLRDCSLVADANTEQWARWWLVYTMPALPLDTADVLHVPHEWNAGHCIGYVTLITPDARTWDWPDRPWDSDVTWDSPGETETLEV